jgi:hypothetical protein
VPARELYGRYRQLIEQLANRPPSSRAAWQAALQDIVGQFRVEAAVLTPSRIELLCWELIEQFEEEALRAVKLQRHEVLCAAVKAFEDLARGG